jgi:hypothetical protein
LQHRKDPNNLSSPLTNDNVNGDVGVDVKWNPSANSAVDATVNPDFSQVESDVPQIEVNQRFALFFPEKRPFFLEGSNLFNTPIQIAYTRTITDPQWGGRFTGKIGTANFTVLASEDEGGGLVVLPGPVSSGFAPQDFKSFVSVGRLKDDFGPSYGSFMFTDREISGGGHNRVLGPDGQWRPNDADVFTGQVLLSSTQDPFLAPFFNGESANSHAMQFRWDHQVTKFDWTLLYNDLGDKFRADLGFVPQVGFREGLGVGAMRFYPQSGPIAFMRTYVTFDKFFLQNNDDLGHDYYPGVFLIGSRNLNAQFEFHNNKVDVGDNGLLTQNYFFYFVQMDPFRHLPRFTFQGRTGDLIDFENGRPGKGTRLSLEAQVRPTDHLTLIGDTIREWLNLDLPAARGRLYTADIERLKAVYVFDSRSFLRVIGQYVTTKRDPALYTYPAPVRDGTFLGSILYGYRLNWQTVLFVGYGDNGVIDESNSLVRTGRSFFFKVSYAIQH